MIKRTLTLLLLPLAINGCYSLPDSLKPMPWLFKQVPKDAPAEFKKGWYDGCESGLASMTNSFYRSSYRFQQDPALRKDPVYYKTWKDTYTFCRHYAYGTIRQSDTRMRLPNNITTMHERIGGGHNILGHNMLNLWGPGTEGMPLKNFGQIGGDPSFGGGVLNAMDFSGDMIMSTNGGSSMNMDFRPAQDSGFYYTTIDGWK